MWLCQCAFKGVLPVCNTPLNLSNKMPLKRLTVKYLRNLTDVDIQPSERVNLFYGINGSGKTSVLEAISVLGMGRSFRSHKLAPLIQQSQKQFTVFGKITDSQRELPIGVSREKSGASLIKVDGVAVSSASALAEHLPFQVINAHTFQLLEGSPKVRRQFIDWLVFHVEPGFMPAWKGLDRCLKHRNSLLRHGRIAAAELVPWDRELVQLATKIHAYRKQILEVFFERFQTLVSEFVSVEGLGISYYRGWDKEREYEQVLVDNFEKDVARGYTQSGPQRADLRITVKGQTAAEILSRGQQKLLVCALRIAQGYVFTEMTERNCIYLMDDLPAELDRKHRQLLAYWLDAMECQVFVTGVEKAVLLDTWAQQQDTEKRVFHVEQGSVVQAS